MLGQKPPRAFPRQAALGPRPARDARSGRGLLLALLCLGGCASVHEATGIATQDDVTQLRTELAGIQQTAQRAKAQSDALAAQLSGRPPDRTDDPQRAAASLTARLDALNATLDALGRRVEEIGGRVDALDRQLRGSAPGSRPTLTAPAPSGPVTPPAPPPAGARPATGALLPDDIYQAAYIDFSKGAYALAIDGFREFLRRFPDNPKAGAAQYWIGEARFSAARAYANEGQRDRAAQALEQAVQEFRKVVANYPRSDKAPTAIYKEALALVELNQPDQALSRLQYLVDNFPSAEETPLARERLATLRRETAR